MRPERKRNRLQHFDYRTQTLYFVTTCVKDQQQWFGRVQAEEMILNEFGKIAEDQFRWLAEQYSFLTIHAHVVMPNHIHAIFEIGGKEEEPGKLSLSQIMAAYKTITSRKIRLAGLPEFAWHRSFHDHIIRDEKSYFNILNYIQNNPANWNKDTFHESTDGA